MPDYAVYANRVIDAYNAKDFERLGAIMAADLDFSHVTRDFAFDNSSDLIALLEHFAANLVPDRRFLPPERVTVCGDIVVREGFWTGTAQTDLPGFAEKGGTIMLKFCSIMRFRDDGTLVEWSDYG